MKPNQNPVFKFNQNQEGFALISVLLVVALIGLLATTYVQRHQLTVITTGFLFQDTQMQQHLKAAETYSLTLLADHKYSQKLKSEYSIAWDEVTDDVQGDIRLKSADGLFNVNNLLVQGPLQQQSWQLFIALVNQNGIGLAEIEEIKKTVQIAYDKGHRSHMGWVRPQEVFDLAGVNLPLSVNDLLVAFPASQTININVAPPDIINALLTDITSDQLDRLMQQRKVKSFKDVNEFLRAAEHAGFKAGEEVASRVAMLAGTQFRFYELDLTAEFKESDDLSRHEKSLIQVHDGLVQVLSHWRL